MLKKIFDVIIIGSGPAGMTSAIYTARKEMTTLVIGKDIGGQMSKTFVIENAPGVEKIDGISLSFKMQEQTESFGAEFETAEIIKIKKENNVFNLIDKDNKNYKAKSVILAFGLEKRKLGLPSESKFEGKGISYCVTCDGPIFKGRDMAVIGGGNAGAEAVEFLAKICPKIYWLEVMNEIKADEIFTNRIKKLNNVKILTSTKILEFLGDDELKGAKIKNNKQENKLKFAGAIVEIGYKANTEWVSKLVELDNFGQIKTNQFCETNTPGIFAVGDITNIKYKQIVIAEGQGAIAGLGVSDYVQKNI